MKMKQIHDTFGTYEINETLIPIDTTKDKWESIRLKVFDNGVSNGRTRWKVQLSFQAKDKSYRNFTAPMLNTYEKARMLRDEHAAMEDNPLFSRLHEVIRNIKKKAKAEGREFDIVPTAGFFHENRMDMPNKLGPTYNDAIAVLFKFKDEYDANVAFRFFDFAYQSEELEETFEKNKRSPKYQELIYLGASNKGYEIK